MPNVILKEHSSAGAGGNQVIYWRSEPPIDSKYQIRKSCHQLPVRLHLPPGGWTAKGEMLLLKFLYPEAKAFNGHYFACYMSR